MRTERSFRTTKVAEDLAAKMIRGMSKPPTELPTELPFNPEHEDARIAAAKAKRERKKARGW